MHAAGKIVGIILGTKATSAYIEIEMYHGGSDDIVRILFE